MHNSQNKGVVNACSQDRGGPHDQKVRLIATHGGIKHASTQAHHSQWGLPHDNIATCMQLESLTIAAEERYLQSWRLDDVEEMILLCREELQVLLKSDHETSSKVPLAGRTLA